MMEGGDILFIIIVGSGVLLKEIMMSGSIRPIIYYYY